MTSLIKIEFEANNVKEAVRKLKEIEQKLLSGIIQDDDFEVLCPLGDSLEQKD